MRVTQGAGGLYLGPVAFTRIVQMFVPQDCVEAGAGLELVNIAWGAEKPRVTDEGAPWRSVGGSDKREQGNPAGTRPPMPLPPFDCREGVLRTSEPGLCLSLATRWSPLVAPTLKNA